MDYCTKPQDQVGKCLVRYRIGNMDTPGKVDTLYSEKAYDTGVCGDVLRKKDEKNFKKGLKNPCILSGHDI